MLSNYCMTDPFRGFVCFWTNYFTLLTYRTKICIHSKGAVNTLQPEDRNIGGVLRKKWVKHAAVTKTRSSNSNTAIRTGNDWAE